MAIPAISSKTDIKEYFECPICIEPVDIEVGNVSTLEECERCRKKIHTVCMNKWREEKKAQPSVQCPMCNYITDNPAYDSEYRVSETPAFRVFRTAFRSTPQTFATIMTGGFSLAILMRILD